MSLVFPECNSLVQIQHMYKMLGEESGRSTFNESKTDLSTRDASELPRQVKIVIIGGGMIGCGIACQLRKANPSLELCIIDPSDYLLQNYRTRVNAINQRVMRSPFDHQIAPDGDLQLLDFAKIYYNNLSDIEKEQVRKASGGQRGIVPFDLFMSHTEHVINNYGLKNIAFKCQADSVSHNGSSYEIILTNGTTIAAESIILAIGLRPKDAFEGQKYGPQILSCYDGPLNIDKEEQVCVVGSGLSAAHVISVIHKSPAKLTWLIRSEQEIYKCTDIKSMYFREEGIRLFQKLPLPNRFDILTTENRGSFMLEFKEFIEELENSGKLKVIRNGKIKKLIQANDKVCLTLQDQEWIFDKIIDCSGLELDPSLFPVGTQFFEDYPILDDDTLCLRGFNNFFVVGALAALSLGPGSKNIEGIRLASQKILHSLNITMSRTDARMSLITGHKAIA